MFYLYWFCIILLFPSFAFAYIGPSLGAGAIALIVIVLFSILLAFGSLVWYPLKAKMKAKKEAQDSQDSKE